MNDKSIRKLTFAVWVLSVLVFINLIVSLFSAFSPPYIANRAITFSPQIPNQDYKNTYEDPYKGFHDWSVDKQIKEASIIILTKWEKDGPKYKCMIVEILKRSPNTTFYYDVGQEYSSQSFYPKDETCYGDGQVVFLVGSPAGMKYSTTYEDDRILGMGDMPLKILRDKIKKIN